MKKKLVVMILAVLIGTAGALAGCELKHSAAPDLTAAYATKAEAEAAGGGWYLTMDENFDYGSKEELFDGGIWTYSPHALRWEPNAEGGEKDRTKWAEGNRALANWWCPDMIEVRDGIVRIKSEQHTKDNPHVCSSGVCPEEGRFTSGIETRTIITDPNDPEAVKGGDTNDKMLFSQAFGYFEARVKFPDTAGMWSAFWLQSSYQRKIGNKGMDGTEIDVYESSFRHKTVKDQRSIMGHALLWDGYGSSSKVADKKVTLKGTDLYDGQYHTFALLWEPDKYTFFIDGVSTWATDAGGVARVAEFLRLTCEIDAGDAWGPHGQKIGHFDPQTGEDTTFYIDYVKVLQHTSFIEHIKLDSDFEGSLDGAN